MRIKKGNVEIELDEVGVKNRFNKSIERTQYLLDNMVARDTSPFVPFLSGALDKSVLPSAQSGNGLLKYNEPYARKMYYNDFRFTKTFHKRACSHWFEVAKSLYKTKWIKFAQKEIRKWF